MVGIERFDASEHPTYTEEEPNALLKRARANPRLSDQLTMMCVMLEVAAASSSSRGAGLSWEKVYEVEPGRHSWIDTVHAKSRDDWYVVGSAGLVHNVNGALKLESSLGASIQTIWDAGAAGLFALGDNQLILRFDGASWITKHLVAKPHPKPASEPKRRWDVRHLVYIGLIASDLPGAPLVAFGPALALVRQADHTWTAPPQSERQNLVLLGEVGRQDKAPRGCHQAEWRWLGKEKAFFTCHQGQGFVYDNGRLTARGKLPRRLRVSSHRARHRPRRSLCELRFAQDFKGRRRRLAPVRHDRWREADQGDFGRRRLCVRGGPECGLARLLGRTKPGG